MVNSTCIRLTSHRSVIREYSKLFEMDGVQVYNCSEYGVLDLNEYDIKDITGVEEKEIIMKRTIPLSEMNEMMREEKLNPDPLETSDLQVSVRV